MLKAIEGYLKVFLQNLYLALLKLKVYTLRYFTKYIIILINF